MATRDAVVNIPGITYKNKAIVYQNSAGLDVMASGAAVYEEFKNERKIGIRKINSASSRGVYCMISWWDRRMMENKYCP